MTTQNNQHHKQSQNNSFKLFLIIKGAPSASARVSARIRLSTPNPEVLLREQDHTDAEDLKRAERDFDSFAGMAQCAFVDLENRGDGG